MLPEFRVEQDNLLKVPSDLLLLKYAQHFYGADKHVAELLVRAGVCSRNDLLRPPDDFVIVETRGHIAPSRVMFLGTPPLRSFSYPEMRRFAARCVEILAGEAPSLKRLSTTIHGVGYGLDAVESLQSLIGGFQEGLAEHPSVHLDEIAFVERNQRRVRILSSALVEMVPGPGQRRAETGSQVPVGGEPASSVEPPPARSPTEPPPRAVDHPVSDKRHVFVAMPYEEKYEDVYEFGIYGPVRQCGFICERVDQTAFTGDILQRIRKRIETADLVIADLTGARPNVYLEVGYAWGKGIPVIFVARHGEEPHFDVKTHRCIYYRTIKQLSRELETLIRGLRDRGDVTL